MCGIIGYVGEEDATPILLQGLQKLEYRGYDSAGIAVRNHNKDTEIIKAEGKLINLIKKVNNNPIRGNIGLGHTRWSTHGKPTIENAHPHHSDDFNIVGVHNGIIENYQELKEKLLRHGYSFYSDTDTEVLIKLVDYYCKKYKHGPIDAINKTVVRARGSYAIAIMFKNYPDQVWFAKKGSPLIVAKGSDGSYLASDITAITEYSKSVYYVEDYECGVITKDNVTFYDLNGDVIDKNPITITPEHYKVDKGNYPHYMIKEIEEQPQAIKKTIDKYIKDDSIDLGISIDKLKSFEEIYIYACGSAYHAGLTAGYIIEELTGINTRVEIASEFRYRNYNLNPNGLAIIISQSGETKDTYEALLKAKDKGIKTLSIVNVKRSVIARESDYNIYTEAGPEISVATTKAYSCQLIVLYLFAIALAKAKNTIDENKYNTYIKEIKKIPSKVEDILNKQEKVQRLASILVAKRDIFFIGRGIDYALCREASLKLKEVTYIHSEAYPAGELKHGTISLIQDGVAVIAVATNDNVFEKTLSNMVEVKSRDGSIIAIASNNFNVDDCSKYQIYIPNIDDIFASSIAIIPLQLLAYYISVAKGIDPDKPRNLAKSVTVE